MSEIKVNKISPRTGTSFTLGDSGDTFTIPSGATITNSGTANGFGSAGQLVDWQTSSIKTAQFTAVSGQGYFANTSGSAFAMLLPSGTAGNIVAVVDYTNSFNSNNLTITPNGSQKIGGVNANAILNTLGQSVTFVYVDDTEGWKNISDSTSNVAGLPPFIQATGGTPSQSGDYEIRTFTSPGTFQVTSLSPSAPENAMDFIVIGAGGGGGTTLAGGGGAGGYKESPGTSTGSYSGSPTKGQGNAVTATVTSYPIVIGAGGAGATSSTNNGTIGAVSTALSITSAGGGYGGGTGGGGAGGSGGGGPGCSGCVLGGSGNTPPASPSQGQSGGAGRQVPGCRGGGGGGGTGAAGTTAPAPYSGGAGGAGVSSSITGSAVSRGGGGGGGGNDSSPYRGGAGGTGGGGAGGGNPSPGGSSGTTGTANTGGGGGGGSGSHPTASNGGSGVVIIRFKRQ